MNNPTISGSSLVLSALLAACSLGGCAAGPPDVDEMKLQSSPISSTTDFKSLGYQDVTNLMKNADAIYLEPISVDELKALGETTEEAKQNVYIIENGGVDGLTGSPYLQCEGSEARSSNSCSIYDQIFPNGYNPDPQGVNKELSPPTIKNAEQHQLPNARQYFESLFISCAGNGYIPDCGNLLLAFVSIGNGTAARSVLESDICRTPGNIHTQPFCWDVFFDLNKGIQNLVYTHDSDKQHLATIIKHFCYDDHYSDSCNQYKNMGGIVDDSTADASVRALEAASIQADKQIEIRERQENDMNSSNTDSDQQSALGENPALDAVKAYAAEHGVNTNNPYKQPYSPPNSTQTPTTSYQSPTEQANTDDSYNQFYSGPDLQNCVAYFFDSGNNLNFKNNCNQAVSVTLTYANAPDPRPDSFNLTPGAVNNTWGGPTGKYIYKVCPAIFPLAVDKSGTPPYNFADMQKQLSCMK